MVALKIVSSNESSTNPKSVEINFLFSVRSKYILFVYDLLEELKGIGREMHFARLTTIAYF